MKNVIIHTEFITLGQFLKFSGLIRSGADAKTFLQEKKVLVNDELEARRGKKLYPNDVIHVENEVYRIER